MRSVRGLLEQEIGGIAPGRFADIALIDDLTECGGQQQLKKWARRSTSPFSDLIFLPFVTLPALRITARGLVNAKERKIVPLFAV
jgi:adenine deaminase